MSFKSKAYSKPLTPLFNDEYYQAISDFMMRKLTEHKFKAKLRSLGHSDELIDLTLVSTKVQASSNILEGCELFYENLNKNNRKTPMGFMAGYMLIRFPSLMKIVMANVLN